MVDISIIVPVYNAEKYIKKCMDSLVKQSKKELEFIIVNDGSTDHSEKMIQSYQDARIKYFKNKNQGIGKTRNFGIEQACGKYLMFLDSDDYLEQDACELLYERCERDNLDVLVCNFYKVFQDHKEEVIIPSFSNTSLKEQPEILLSINLAPWNKIYRRDLIEQHHIRFVENLKYEDAPFVVESLLKAKNIGSINTVSYDYVIHENSETTVRDQKVFDILKIIDKIRVMSKQEVGLEKVVDELTVQIIMNYNIQQRCQKDWQVGKQFIQESFAYLEKEVPHYKRSDYLKKRSFLKTFIEKHKIWTLLYCYLYWRCKKCLAK